MDNEKSFDDIAKDYDALLDKNLSKYGKDISYYAEYKLRLVKKMTTQDRPDQFLEFGCGTGRNLKYIKIYFPKSNITAADLSHQSLRYASEQPDNEGVFFTDINRLMERGIRFDLIFIANVFHHIVPEKRAYTMTRLSNLLADNGELFIFEHNQYNPLTRRAVNTCPFDEGVTLLKPIDLLKLARDNDLQVVLKHYCLFLPSMLKRFAFIERFLSYIPMGAQYFVKLEKSKTYKAPFLSKTKRILGANAGSP